MSTMAKITRPRLGAFSLGSKPADMGGLLSPQLSSPTGRSLPRPARAGGLPRQPDEPSLATGPAPLGPVGEVAGGVAGGAGRVPGDVPGIQARLQEGQAVGQPQVQMRSEERRVGKEGRSWWARYHWMKTA